MASSSGTRRAFDDDVQCRRANPSRTPSERRLGEAQPPSTARPSSGPLGNRVDFGQEVSMKDGR